MSPVVLTLIQSLVILSVAPMSVGLTRFFKARFQGRHGAVPWLPYFSLATLLKKENLVSTTSSWMFRATPYMVLVTSLFLMVVLPLVTVTGLFAGLSNFILVGSVLVLGASFMVLGGLDVGSGFGGLGASRTMTMVSLLEPTFVLTFAALAIATGTSSIDGMLAFGSEMGGLFNHAPYLILSILALMLLALAENARYPVDNPATHLELTMVHEATLLDYSGPYLAMLEYASALKLTVFAILIVNLILPAPLLAQSSEVVDVIIVIAATLLKVFGAMLSLAILESTIAKVRFYRVQEFLTGAFFLALTGITLALLATLL